MGLLSSILGRGAESPVEIRIAGEKLIAWTAMTLEQARENLTGELSVQLFTADLPTAPLLPLAIAGADITVFIAGEPVFTGLLDKRLTSGNYGACWCVNSSIGSAGYSMELMARGKAAILVDSSHFIPGGTIRNTTDREAIEKLAAQHGVSVKWNASENKAEKIVLRDGGLTINEIYRICDSNCHFVREDGNGNLVITDQPDNRGAPIILGLNILEFHTEQGSDNSNDTVLIKGHVNKKGVRGKAAITEPRNTQYRSQDNNATGRNKPLTLQRYFENDAAGLERRARWELERRAAESNRVNVKVFDVIDQNGAPWALGKIYPLTVPTESIDGDYECIRINYSVSADAVAETTLTLAPRPQQVPAQDRNRLAGKPADTTPARTSENNKPVKGWKGTDIIQAPLPPLEGANVSDDYNSLLKRPD